MARIDELQRNLENLAGEAAKSAKDAAAAASPGSREKELEETRQKYALLMKEGQKLESEASNSRTAVRRLRQQLAENSKSQIEMKKKAERLERDLLNTESRAKRAEAAEKRANDSLSTHNKTAKDLEAVTNERDALSQTVREMKAQIGRAIARAEAAEAKAHSDALEKEKRRADELDEELSNTRIELDIIQAKSKKEIADLKEKVDQEKERARLLETELKGEQSALESKMESLRARAEEASSGATGETQAKLLRQVETLQTQYSVASENWHTLEGSYISRLDAAEKERDQAGDREKELRKKLRETVWLLLQLTPRKDTSANSIVLQTLKVKELEEELENAKEAEHDLQSQLEARVQELQKVQQKLENATDEVTSAQKELVEQKKVWDANWAQKLEEERARWREQVNTLQQPRGISPVPSTRRSSNLDALPSILSDYRPGSRRSSTLPPGSPDIGTPPRQNSYPTSIAQGTLSPPPISTTMGPPSMILETPSITFEPDEFFSSGDPATPSAYGGTQAGPSRGINDIISESTVGAGPSVQLVERMSATVRRLESERAGSKDELARVTTQRDESRQQVVDLMRELEEKKTTDSRVEELEAKLADIDQRYLTTLEMLGEKSEQVEELQADIADLKKIYRELVDSTMK
jgi:chromosome segregation ATPase